MLALRLSRYVLVVILLALAVTWLNILWVFVGGLNASPPWYSRLLSALVQFNFEVPGHFKMRRFSAEAPPDVMSLLVTSTIMLVSVVLTLCVLSRFERKEREAIHATRDKVAAPTAPPLTVEVIPPRKIEAQRQPPEIAASDQPRQLAFAQPREEQSGEKQ